MYNIGNYQDARFILEWVRKSPFDEYDMRPTVVEESLAPEGWKFLGRGSFRSVWESPDGVAYKVQHQTGYSSQQTDEVENLKLAWSRRPPEGCRLPKFNSFEVNDELVVVMELVRGVTLFEYCSGERSALYDLMHEVERAYRLLDVHDENVMVDEDGILVPVDFGC